MYRIALLHTVPTVYQSFPALLKTRIPDAIISNTVDEYLASDAEVKGCFTKENWRRLYNIIDACEKTHPDVIGVTCSTLSPHIVGMRSYFETPLVTIDELMISEAVRQGHDILIVSTAESTVGPTKSKLLAEAKIQGKDIKVSNIVCGDAYVAIKNRDKDLHDRLVLEMLGKAPHDYDCIVLAQASMGHLEQRVGDLCHCTICTSPHYCVEDLYRTLHK